MTVPTFSEQLASDMQDSFFNTDELAETVTYERDDISADLPAVFRQATIDDPISEYVSGDVIICYIREVDLHTFFDRAPDRTDTFTRTLTSALGQGIRTEAWTVVERFRDDAHTWKLVCERNTRLHP